MLPHNVDDSGADERVFDDEWIKIRGSVSHDSSHNWVPSANRRVIDS